LNKSVQLLAEEGAFMASKYMYTPLLRWKLGEQAAMHHVSVTGKVGVRPLIVLLREHYADTKPPPKKPKKQTVVAADTFCRQVSVAWGTAELLLDASDLPALAARHMLDDLASAARAAKLLLVPATTLNASAAYQAAADRMAATDGRGIALRVSLPEMASASVWSKTWSHPLSETDLIVDLGKAAPTVATLGPAVASAFAGLHSAANWRTVTVAGSSMPQNFSGFAVGPHQIQRAELSLWATLAAHGLPYRIDFGDYATVPTDLAAPGIPWGYPINAKYTLSDRFLIFHGVGTTGANGVAMGTQLLGHARSIVGFRGRGRLSHCWGDAQIDAVAAGTLSPSGLPTWVKYSVNRHIEVTRAGLP